MVALLVVALAVPNAAAQDSGSGDGAESASEGESGSGTTAEADPADSITISQWVRESGAHQIAGYSSLALATTTATLGLLGYAEIHPYFGAATAAFSVSAATLGLIGYHDYLSFAWPHAVLNGLAATGFLLNAFVFEGGSPAHITSGLTATASMIGAISYIVIVTR